MPKAKTPAKTTRTSARSAKKPPPPPSPTPSFDDSSTSDSDSEDDAITSAINTASAAIAKKFNVPDESGGNELTFLIPGYTAPMSLESGVTAPLYIEYDKKKKDGTGAAVFDMNSFGTQQTVVTVAKTHIMTVSPPPVYARCHMNTHTAHCPSLTPPIPPPT